jgi:ketosteroid isomerase-like protein
MMKRWIGAWTDYSYEVRELIDVGESVVIVVDEAGRGRGSGVPMEQHYAQIWTFENQRIVRGTTCKSKEEALEVAAGL